MLLEGLWFRGYGFIPHGVIVIVIVEQSNIVSVTKTRECTTRPKMLLLFYNNRTLQRLTPLWFWYQLLCYRARKHVVFG